jgi:putative transposase
MQYRRAFIPGGSYFFTLVTERRRKLFVDEANVVLLRRAFHHVMRKRPFVLDAAVIMPDHLHCIWTLLPDDADFSTRWRLIKTWFTKNCDDQYKSTANASCMKKSGQAIWQHRYWEHLLRDESDFERHVDYIHYNPVKHGYVKRPLDWKYSSLHRYVKQGVISEKWGESYIDFPGDIGNE